MLRRVGLVLLLLCFATLARAAEAPEQLLPAGSQVYVRWDGVAAHRGSFEKSALGKVLQGDTGKFLTHVLEQAQETLGTQLTIQELFRGEPPARLRQLLTDASESPKLFSLVAENGFILGVELRSVNPPRGQVAFILPGAGAKATPLFGALRLSAALAKQQVREKKIDGRSVWYTEMDGKLGGDLNVGPLTQAWWVEDGHAILAAGTDTVDALVKRFDPHGERLPQTARFKRLGDFKEFETGARAIVDVAALRKVIVTADERAAKVLAAVGVDGIESVMLHSGFDGDTERGVMEVHLAPGARKGMLSLLGGKPFKLTDLPPLPDDLVSWSATNFDLKTFHDEAIEAVKVLAGIFAPDQAATVEETLKKLPDILGIDPRKDLLEHLGDRFVQYSSPGEGLLSFGQVYLFSVKDEKKLLAGIDSAVRAAGRQTGVDVGLRKRLYRGVEVREVHVRQQGFIFVPTLAVVDGWLAVSYYPQPIHGLILRSKGEIPVWKPDARTRDAFDRLPKEFISVGVSDPRPTMKTALAAGPVVVGAVRSFLPESRLEVGLMPNSHEVNRHLFPNVSVTQLDGNVLRLHSRSSLALPVDLNSPEVLLYLGLLGQIAAGLDLLP